LRARYRAHLCRLLLHPRLHGLLLHPRLYRLLLYPRLYWLLLYPRLYDRCLRADRLRLLRLLPSPRIILPRLCQYDRFLIAGRCRLGGRA
jgi:hypothetical protein